MGFSSNNHVLNWFANFTMSVYKSKPDQWSSVHSDNGMIVARMVSGDFFGEIGILNLSCGINKYVNSCYVSDVTVLQACLHICTICMWVYACGCVNCMCKLYVCKYVCECVSMHMSVCTCVYACDCMYVCISVWICIRMYSCKYMRVSVSLWVYACEWMLVYSCVSAYECMLVNMCPFTWKSLVVCLFADAAQMSGLLVTRNYLCCVAWMCSMLSKTTQLLRQVCGNAVRNVFLLSVCEK